MGFFDTDDKPGTVTANLCSQAWARTLRDNLAIHRRLTARTSLAAWAREFAALQRHRTNDEIGRALRWYCDNIGKPFVPDVRSAQAFRKKFPAIEAAMARVATPGQRPPTPAALAIVKRKQYTWPGGDKDKAQEAQFVQDTMDAWLDLIRRIKAARAAATRDPPGQLTAAGFNHRFFIHLSKALNPDPVEAAVHWLEEIHTFAWLRDKGGQWAGNLGRYAMRLDHWRIQKLLEHELQFYTGMGRDMEWLMGELNAH
jgi:hypothetical protein